MDAQQVIRYSKRPAQPRDRAGGIKTLLGLLFNSAISFSTVHQTAVQGGSYEDWMNYIYFHTE